MISLNLCFIALQTVNKSKLKAALKSSGDVMTEERLDTLVCLELDKEKQILQDEFSRKVRELSTFQNLQLL